MYDVEDFDVHDCFTTLNGEEGLYILFSENINLASVIVKNNNASDTEDFGGIIIRDSSSTRFTSCQSYDDRDNPLQRWGIYTGGVVDFIEITNCKLMPNKKSAIYNYAGAVITLV